MRPGPIPQELRDQEALAAYVLYSVLFWRLRQRAFEVVKCFFDCSITQARILVQRGREIAERLWDGRAAQAAKDAERTGDDPHVCDRYRRIEKAYKHAADLEVGRQQLHGTGGPSGRREARRSQRLPKKPIDVLKTSSARSPA